MKDLIYQEDRELTNIEYANLCDKANNGALPVEYFRKNLFNATTRTSKQLKRNKTIYDDGKLKIQINRSLHQKHRDLLSIVFLDNKGIKKPNKDGSYLIFHNLYDIAKKMGYKSPKNSIHLIKNWLNDLRQTDLIYETERFERGHMILGKYFEDKETGRYAIKIPSETAKYHILNFAIQIPKELNKKIIAIPNKYAKTKALISYILSNKALKNGISFENICDKLDINIKQRKSEFKKELKENEKLLRDFNIVYDEETEIIKYKQLETVVFHSAIKEKILEAINKEKQVKEPISEVHYSLSDKNIETLSANEQRYKKLCLRMIGTKFIIQNQSYKIDNIIEKEGTINLLLTSLESERSGVLNTGFFSWNTVYTNYFTKAL